MLKGFTREYRGLIYYTEETVKWSTWEKYYEKSISLCCLQKCGVYKLYIESLKNLCVPPHFFPYFSENIVRKENMLRERVFGFLRSEKKVQITSFPMHLS